MSNQLFEYGLFGVLAVLVIVMFLNSRRRNRQAAEAKTQMVPGTEIMTTQGIFGTIISIDEDKNEAIIESTPGTRLRVHRQTLSRIVEPAVDDDDDDLDTPVDSTSSTLTESSIPVVHVDTEVHSTSSDDLPAPAYGERVDATKPKRAPRKKAGE